MNTQTSKSRCLVLCLSLIALGGCSANAQLVRKDATGGEVAVWGATVPAARQARHAIVEHCRSRFTVGVGAETYGLGAANPMLVSSSHGHSSAALPSNAQLLTFQCIRNASAARASADNTATAHEHSARN